jgi:predicted exporter
VAVLSSAGLATAWLFVVILYPIVFTSAQPTHLTLMSRIAVYLSRAPWAGTTGGVLAAIVVIVSLSLGFLSFKLEFNQTVTSLYQGDESAIQSDQRVAELMSGLSPVRFFLVNGDNVEQVLERMETFRPQCIQMISTTQT